MRYISYCESFYNYAVFEADKDTELNRKCQKLLCDSKHRDFLLRFLDHDSTEKIFHRLIPNFVKDHVEKETKQNLGGLALFEGVTWQQILQMRATLKIEKLVH